MNYFEMTTEKLETLKSDIEEKLDGYIGMTFPSTRSEYVSYEIDSADPDEVLITVNHYFNGLIRDYKVTINGGIDDDVEYNRYNTDEEIVDGGYMSFDRLPKVLRNAVIELYELYRELETINNILDSRTEEETEEESEEGKFKELESLYSAIGEKFEELESLYSSIEEKFEGLKKSISILEEETEEESEEEDKGVHTMNRKMLLTVKRVIPQLYEVSYRGQHITDLFKTDLNDWRFAGLFFSKAQNKALYLLLTTVFNMRFKTKKQATIELEYTFARFEVAKDELEFN